jgi:hypothetical protein
MRGGLSGADDSANFFVTIGPRMDDHQQHGPDSSDCSPAVTVWMRVRLGQMQWVVEHDLGCLKRHAMLGAVSRSLFGVPRPAHL